MNLSACYCCDEGGFQSEGGRGFRGGERREGFDRVLTIQIDIDNATFRQCYACRILIKIMQGYVTALLNRSQFVYVFFQQNCGLCCLFAEMPASENVQLQCTQRNIF